MPKEKEDKGLFRVTGYCLQLTLIALLWLFANSATAQTNDYSFKSSDNEIGMDVSRGDKGIDISLLFTRASGLDYVMIEKSADSQNSFSQCKYIKFNESANDTVVIIKRDTYPLSSSEDVYYRVKVITKEGISRVYPSVRLPGLKEEKTH